MTLGGSITSSIRKRCARRSLVEFGIGELDRFGGGGSGKPEQHRCEPERKHGAQAAVSDIQNFFSSQPHFGRALGAAFSRRAGLDDIEPGAERRYTSIASASSSSARIPV